MPGKDWAGEMKELKSAGAGGIPGRKSNKKTGQPSHRSAMEDPRGRERGLQIVKGGSFSDLGPFPHGGEAWRGIMRRSQRVIQCERLPGLANFSIGEHRNIPESEELDFRTLQNTTLCIEENPRKDNDCNKRSFVDKGEGLTIRIA